ncbi:MAG TPA: glycoside hydrolase family 97 catalytic domain-containing protein [Gemmataceae bacterium]|nr:glycoside hydrolase family 97 catalytic domain-containing protein [Gemmataceae bacterium]
MSRTGPIMRLLCVALLLIAPVVRAADDVTLASPDGAVRFRLVRLHGDRLAYEVRFKDKPAVGPSRLGLTVDGADLGQGAAVGSPEPYAIDDKHPLHTGHALAVAHSNGIRVPVKHPKTGTAYTLDVRAFNDGVAFRFVVPGDGPRVPDEATAFTLPAGSTVWFHDLEGHYEAAYKKADVSVVPAGQWVGPPLTARLPDNLGYVSITEAALTNYSGMALKAAGDRTFDAVLGHAHHVSYPFRLRYKADIERLSKPAAVSGPITTPWRVIMVAADLNALVNSDLVANLAPPPDPKLFPAGAKTDWVKPGRAVWKYLDGGQGTVDGVKEFSRLAGELGFEYQVVEGFWSRWTDAQVKDVVDYSRKQGVGLWFWRHSRELRTPEAREAFFQKLEDSGVVGAKIDFFDHEHKEVVDLYQALLRDAARHRILVNFHGANKPTGESRTWPNELIREGVRGMESSKLLARAQHNTTLPFTRYLAGPADYTPVLFGPRRGDTTWAHQVATAVVFTEPLLTYGAHPKTLLDHPAVEMIKSIPATWDETVVLPPSEIGEVAVFARRKGDAWFLAVLNGPAARRVKVPLAFLGNGKYHALEVRDDPTEAAAVRVEKAAANRDGSVTLELPAGGGFVGRYTH